MPAVMVACVATFPLNVLSFLAFQIPERMRMMVVLMAFLCSVRAASIIAAMMVVGLALLCHFEWWRELQPPLFTAFV